MRAVATQTLPRPTETLVNAGELVTVSIGRNTPDGELHLELWQEFIGGALLAVAQNTVEPFGPFRGTGYWEGKPEDAAVITGVVRYPFNEATLTERLTTLAARYGQEAIAWSHGENIHARP
jgi:hypothetical protein